MPHSTACPALILFLVGLVRVRSKYITMHVTVIIHSLAFYSSSSILTTMITLASYPGPLFSVEN